MGSAASAGTVGILIPPSGSLVIIGILAELSIGKLFIAGIFPGIISVLVYMLMVNIRCTINPLLAPPGAPTTWREKIVSLRNSWSVIIVFAVVIGGLYTGIASATEVAALGCFITLAIAFLSIARKRTTWGALKRSVIDAVEISAMIFAFVVGAGIFSLFVTLSGILPQVVQAVSHFQMNSTVIMIIICLCYIPLGMFFDPLSMVIVTVPIVFPIVTQGLGFDPIWFSIITVKLVELSVITPPVGLNLFIMKGVFPEVSLGTIIRGCGWFMIMDVLTIALLFIFPQIVTWLPGTMMQQ